MSFQAYLDTIRKQTGKGPEDFRKLAEARGYLREHVKASEVIGWLKSEFKLGHGHAMAVYTILRAAVEPAGTPEERLAQHFKGPRARWSGTYEKILSKISAPGNDAPSVKVGDSYISLLRNGKKFAILKVGVDFLDLGIKLNKDVSANARLKKAGNWNSMVSHRVRLAAPADLDSEVILWLKAAYVAAER
jgi:hypothetical protein